MLKSASHRSKCDVNDYFILYYEGHGTVLRDPDFQVGFGKTQCGFTPFPWDMEGFEVVTCGSVDWKTQIAR